MGILYDTGKLQHATSAKLMENVSELVKKGARLQKIVSILFKNKDSIGGFTRLDYWNLEEGVNKDLAWYQNFFEGKKIATFKYLKCRIRAIKIIIK